jgi:hypothetical protein
MRRLYLLQRKLSSALFGTRKASYSSIFWQNNELSVQLIIINFLKTV